MGYNGVSASRRLRNVWIDHAENSYKNSKYMIYIRIMSVFERHAARSSCDTVDILVRGGGAKCVCRRSSTTIHPHRRQGHEENNS